MKPFNVADIIFAATGLTAQQFPEQYAEVLAACEMVAAQERKRLDAQQMREMLRAMQAGELTVSRGVELIDMWLAGNYSDDQLPPVRDLGLGEDDMPADVIESLRAQISGPRVEPVDVSTPFLRGLVERIALEVDPDADLAKWPDALAFQIELTRAVIKELRLAAPSAPVPSFQSRVMPWLLECFGAEIAADKVERNHRFLEEALELVQALGCSQSEAHQLVDYTFNRPIGEPHQEVGGVMVTLAALCLANNLDMAESGEVELARIWTKVEKIRAKQAAKPKHSPLPEAPVQAAPDAVVEALQSLKEQVAAIVCHKLGHPGTAMAFQNVVIGLIDAMLAAAQRPPAD